MMAFISQISKYTDMVMVTFTSAGDKTNFKEGFGKVESIDTANYKFDLNLEVAIPSIDWDKIKNNFMAGDYYNIILNNDNTIILEKVYELN